MTKIDCSLDVGGNSVSLTPLISSNGGYYVPASNTSSFYLFNLCEPISREPSPCAGGQAGNAIYMKDGKRTCDSLGNFDTFKLNSGKVEGDVVRTVGSMEIKGGEACKTKDDKDGQRSLRVQLVCVEHGSEEGMDDKIDDGCHVELEWRNKGFCAQKTDGSAWCTGDDVDLLTSLPEATLRTKDSPITVLPCRQASSSSECPKDSSICRHDQSKSPLVLGRKGTSSRAKNRIRVTYTDGAPARDGLPRVTGIDYVCAKDATKPSLKLVDSALSNSSSRLHLLYAHSALCAALSPINLPPDSPNPDPSSGGGFSTFLFWFIFSITLAYFVIGYIYKRVYWNMQGFDALPNSDTFRAIGRRVGLVNQYHRIQI